MSTIIMGKCWPLKMPPASKAVLVSLADNANDHGVAWPAIPKICERTCLGRTAVIEALKWLERHGALQVSRSGRSNRYTLTPDSFEWSASRTSPPPGPVRLPDQSASRTSPPPGHQKSACRTSEVRLPDPNRKEPSRNRHTRDALFEAVAGACLIDWRKLTKSGRGRLNRAVKEIREAGGKPEDVGHMVRQFTTRYPGAQLTPTALAAHWGQYEAPAAARSPAQTREQLRAKEERIRIELAESERRRLCAQHHWSIAPRAPAEPAARFLRRISEALTREAEERARAARAAEPV